MKLAARLTVTEREALERLAQELGAERFGPPATARERGHIETGPPICVECGGNVARSGTDFVHEVPPARQHRAVVDEATLLALRSAS